MHLHNIEITKAAIGTTIATLLIMTVYSKIIKFITRTLQTPLPKITTNVIVPPYKPITPPYNPLSHLKEYSDKYRDKYEKLKEEYDEAEVNAIVDTLMEEHVTQLTHECTEINLKINNIRPFATPSISEFQTETPGDTGIDIARKQLTVFITSDDVWRNIHTKYGKSNIPQIEALLLKFEELYYNKAYEMVGVDNDDDEPEPEPEPELEMGNIYPADDDDDNNDNNDNDDNDGTTTLTPAPHRPTLLEKVTEFMANNVKYAYIQLYFYDLWLACIAKQIAEIRTGDHKADYIERAKEQYYRTKYQRLMHCIVSEYTPLGNVYMYYNADNTSFEYYSDKTIPFPVLETVARKYVITYRCKELYVDVAMVEMREQDTIAYRKLHAFSGPPKSTEMAAHAAALERQATSAAASQKLLAKAPIRSWGESSSLLPNEPALKEYKHRVNNFIKKGSAIQFNPLQPVDRKVTNRRLKMSFADWQRERNAAKIANKTIPGMAVPDEIRKFTGGADSDNSTSATF